jgi:hypothetical protein
MGQERDIDGRQLASLVNRRTLIREPGAQAPGSLFVPRFVFVMRLVIGWRTPWSWNGPLTRGPTLPYTFHKAESKFHKAETVEEPGKRGKIDQSPPRKDLR